ncbi:MAG TPA: hypothetical protein VGS97_08695 [Actinocrinis sp.]|uniref:hypothetical protein n=1 Tax=Actinocrinis sp. TaxID=1920516 RepID=UPI002DDC9112|nr:hypothetical protein [Actinocrinis sp.]HEV2344155.1 hypothetical protein [Actinocrinis sp.]
MHSGILGGAGRSVLVVAAVLLCTLAGPTGTAAAKTASTASPSTNTGAIRPHLVRPFTGTGCHTYDYWSGAHVCITVVGSGLNVQSVTGETDGPDSDWGHLWDTAGVISIYGHPTNHHLTVSWASGGGVWLANGDNFCFTDTTLNQTACLTIHN